MKGNDTKNKKIIRCMLAAMIIFEIIKVKAQNAATIANACLKKKGDKYESFDQIQFDLTNLFYLRVTFISISAIGIMALIISMALEDFAKYANDV